MEARTYVVTGAASGIGAATADNLAKAGAEVIRCDVRDADVLADLTTREGRDRLVSEVTSASGGRIDGLIAVAGLALPSEATVRLNFFGTIATLEGLRPLLAASPEPRAVAVSSLSAIVAADEPLVEACLSLDEEAAAAAARETVAAGRGRIVYPSSKLALNRWLRRAALDWAGSGIPLNAVAPGVVDTETARTQFLDDPATRAFVSAAMPQPLGLPGPVAAVASLLAWTAGADNAFMTGQILYADGGAEATLRP
ncbi:SDR family NAD(P)-dependent oxidoreductase [Nonomuraea sp. NPDC050404]|uniref:SDR family oxidoreductase n=1 Tax=Nonomuraea sp. NPDC050404 TaxID=3155783 RepID=UPI0033F73A43